MSYPSLVHRSGFLWGRLGIFCAHSPCQLCGSTGKVRTYQLRERTLSSAQTSRLCLCRGCCGGVEGYAQESQGLYTLRKGRQEFQRAPTGLHSRTPGKGVVVSEAGIMMRSFRESLLRLPHGVMRHVWTLFQRSKKAATLRLRGGPAALFLRSSPFGDPFRSAYILTPLKEIDRPQKEFVRLEQSGEIRGRVLDVGCGAGENALYLAGLGYPMLGVDIAPTAIEQARGKARTRGGRVEFQVWDALELPGLERRFDTVIDSGLFHVLSNSERKTFAHSLAAALRPEGTYQMLCFSEREPGLAGPRRVTEAEIRATFGKGWKVESIRKAKYETQLPTGDAQAWVCSITRLHARNDEGRYALREDCPDFQRRVVPTGSYLGTFGKRHGPRRWPS